MDKYLKQVLSIDVKRRSSVILREDIGQHVHIFSHIRLTMFVELMILNLKGNHLLSTLSVTHCCLATFYYSFPCSYLISLL